MSVFSRNRARRVDEAEMATVEQPRRVETAGDRKALATAAGLGDVSTPAVLAGTLTATSIVFLLFGGLGTVVGGVAGGTASMRSATTWGLASAVIAVFTVWAAFTFGGYTSGRMARRVGATNGFLVAYTAFMALLVGLAVLVRVGDAGAIGSWLRHAGVRATAGWETVGAVTGLACLAVMMLTATLGGAAGERWHTVFIGRAFSAATDDLASSSPTVDGVDRAPASQAAVKNGREVRASDDEVIDVRSTKADKADASTQARARVDAPPQGRR